MIGLWEGCDDKGCDDKDCDDKGYDDSDDDGRMMMIIGL